MDWIWRGLLNRVEEAGKRSLRRRDLESTAVDPAAVISSPQRWTPGVPNGQGLHSLVSQSAAVDPAV